MRHGISLRALRQQAKKSATSEGTGLVVRRSMLAPSATYGAAALEALPESACRWPLGDPAEPGVAICRAARSGRRSYCRDHLSQAVQGDNCDAR